MSTPENKSYLSAGVAGISALSPWGSRSATPRSQPPQDNEDAKSDSGIGAQRGGDHTINPRHRLSLKSYPRDCPPLAVQWFHAVDQPKRKPLPSGPLAATESDKPLPKPRKWVPFSAGDSRAIESLFQRLADEAEATNRQKDILNSPGFQGQDYKVPDTETKTKVPVNEDFLFDVDIETRELAPAYWLGPVWDVRRGTWFRQDGTPCDENLATQLEEGFLKTKPWRYAQREKRATSQSRPRPTSMTFKGGDELRKVTNQSRSTPITPRGSSDSLRGDTGSAPVESPNDNASHLSPQDDVISTHRLFGVYMNSVVTYQNATTAYLLKDDYYSRMSSTVYQRFAGGAHYAGEKFTRGFVDLTKKKDGKDDDRPGTSGSTSSNEASKDGKPPNIETNAADTNSETEDEPLQSPSEARRKTLERHLSSLVTSTEPENREKQEEESRRRDEKEIRDDYKEQSNDEQGREIEHLLLVTHGIGQRLGMRMESVNFVHDVNTLRKSLKAGTPSTVISSRLGYS